MQLVTTIHFEELDILELCDYLQFKYYENLRYSLSVVNKYSSLVNIETHKISETQSILQLLLERLLQESNKLINNDILILFPKLKENEIKHINLSSIDKVQHNILDLLSRIKLILNNYIVLPQWNVYTQLLCNELKSIDFYFSDIIYLKEHFIKSKINAIHAQ